MKYEIMKLMSDKYGWTTEEIENATDFEELGLDSLSLYSLVTDCEKEFDIKVDTDDITQINTPEKFISYLEGKRVL